MGKVNTADYDIPHVMTLYSRFPFDRSPSGWIGDADGFHQSIAWSRYALIRNCRFSQSAHRGSSTSEKQQGEKTTGMYTPGPHWQAAKVLFEKDWLRRWF
jgi:hypothetical protein